MSSNHPPSVSPGRGTNPPHALHLPHFIRNLARLGRLKYLVYSWVLFSLGMTVASFSGATPDWTQYVHGLAFVWCTHLMTHYCNEYFDLQADVANQSPTRWTGGSRVLVEGKLTPKVSISAAFLLLFCAVALTVAMPSTPRWLAFATILVAWFYTSPPINLNYVGLGELGVTTVLNGLVPMIGYAMATGDLSLLPIMVLLPAFIIQYVRMLLMNLADRASDEAVRKRTAVVILGTKRTLIVHAVGQALAYSLLIPGVMLWNMPSSVALAIVLTSPLALRQVWWLYRGDYKREVTANAVVFWASSHSALVVVAAYVGLLVDAYRSDGGVLSIPSVSALALPLHATPPALFLVILLLQVWSNGRSSEETSAPE